jgi:tRNA threonylcarbamoyladenosine biosynthesis protein TsaE
MVLALEGDLGCGKTVFVKGLAEGLMVPKDIYVTSPSYTLIHEYPGRLPLFHIDLYRIENAADIDDLGLFDIMGEKNVVAIEWAERIRDALPPEGMILRFEILNDEVRKISMKASGLQALDVLRTLR